MENKEKIKGSYYYVKTFGCQMNEHDSEYLAGMMEKEEITKTENIEEADIIILNTCCIRASAENKIIGLIGNIKNMKKTRPDLTLVVCGCMVQQPEMFARIKEKIKHVDIVLGTQQLHLLPEYLRKRQQKGGFWGNIDEISEIRQEGLPLLRQNPWQGMVNIIYGCNNFCTYCIVPYVRGREKSRPSNLIIAEVEELVASGRTEVVLLGQNVNSYGHDLEEKVDFAQLLAQVDQVPGIERIRFMTSHPKDFTDELIEVIAASSHVCDHIHLPMQAGSTKILQSMNRGYTRESYLELVQKIQTKLPGFALTTDIIVGFPGETETDFQETLAMVKSVGFDLAYTFMYSARQGTKAADFENQVALAEKKQRLAQLIQCQNEITAEKSHNLLRSIQEVIVEGVSKNSADYLTGRTGSNKIIHFSGDESLIGQKVKVEVTKASTWNLQGQLL